MCLWQVQKMCMVWRGFIKSGMDDSRTKTPSVCCNWAILFPLWKLWPSSHPHALNALHVPETQANGPNTAGMGTSVWLAAKVCSLDFPIFMPFPESYQKHSFFHNLVEEWQMHGTFLYSLGSKITSFMLFPWNWSYFSSIPVSVCSVFPAGQYNEIIAQQILCCSLLYLGRLVNAFWI